MKAKEAKHRKQTNLNLAKKLTLRIRVRSMNPPSSSGYFDVWRSALSGLIYLVVTVNTFSYFRRKKIIVVRPLFYVGGTNVLDGGVKNRPFLYIKRHNSSWGGRNWTKFEWEFDQAFGSSCITIWARSVHYIFYGHV